MKNRKENLSGSTVSVRPAVSFSLSTARLEQQRTPTDLDNRVSRAVACSSKKESQISSMLVSIFCYESVESLGLHRTSLGVLSRMRIFAIGLGRCRETIYGMPRRAASRAKVRAAGCLSTSDLYTSLQAKDSLVARVAGRL